MNEQYRVEDKGNVYVGQKPRTSFALYSYDASQRSYVRTGGFFAPGHDATDKQCIAYALRELED